MFTRKLSRRAFSLVGAFTIALASNSASAQEAPDDTSTPYYSQLSSGDVANLTELTCWDVTTLGEDDRAFALILLYGYAKGAAGDAELAPRDVQIAVINSMMQCLDEPDSVALDVLSEHIANLEG